MKTLLLTTAFALLLPAAAVANPGHDHGGSSAFGEPGDPKAPSRTVEIVMKETDDGKMLFEPSAVMAKRGEQIRFVLKNNGQLDHEFMLATRAHNDRHAIEMRKNPDMEHDEPNARKVLAGETAEILWKFSKAGEFNFSCLIPGHREAGMDGSVVVK